MMRPDADRCIGFFYVDHEKGIIFRIHSLCRIEPGKPPEFVVNFENHGEGLILHSDEVGRIRFCRTTKQTASRCSKSSDGASITNRKRSRQ